VGRRRKEGKYKLQKTNSIEDLVGNEENGYPIPDPSKIMINVTKVKQRTLLKKKRKIYEVKKTTQNIKEELNKDMENLRKKESNRNPRNKKLF
jgi:hypothetical protein